MTCSSLAPKHIHFVPGRAGESVPGADQQQGGLAMKCVLLLAVQGDASIDVE